MNPATLTPPASPSLRPPPDLAALVREASVPPTARDTADAERWRRSVADFYDRMAAAKLPSREHYYYRRLRRRLADMVPPRSRVLDLGCGTGELLSALRPAVGVGVDLSTGMIREARRRHPHLRFLRLAAEEVHRLHDTFDYVVISQTLGEIYDLQALFQALQRVCHARTRVLVAHDSRLWQPALKLAEWTRLKRPTPERNWIPSEEVAHLLRLAGFETVRVFGMTPCPLPVPGLGGLVNRWVANLPGMHHLGLNYVLVARSVRPEGAPRRPPRSVSIVVPARNEAGHIRLLLERIPRIAPQQEIIFVEGGSSDDTWAVLRDVVGAYSGPFELKCLQQRGRGKGNAVREGFAAATGDVLIILDADLSVPPEELPGFFACLASGAGELINGSRMVYLMDRRAMRFLNLLANKCFGWVFTYLLSQRFRDTLCGTKALWRDDYERIAANRAYFGDFDPFGDFDLLFGAARLNLKIIDLPVHYKARVYGETNISRFRHGWMLLRMCLLAARKVKFL
ncbi:MAG: glycosyltransferase [Planctomycetes bacterium]|nr:glycosyltransferase [Planctomycetota bacterium]